MDKYLVSYTYTYKVDGRTTDSRNYATSCSLWVREVEKTVNKSGIFTIEELNDLVANDNIVITHSQKL